MADRGHPATCLWSLESALPCDRPPSLVSFYVPSRIFGSLEHDLWSGLPGRRGSQSTLQEPRFIPWGWCVHQQLGTVCVTHMWYEEPLIRHSNPSLSLMWHIWNWFTSSGKSSSLSFLFFFYNSFNSFIILYNYKFHMNPKIYFVKKWNCFGRAT